MCLLLVNLLIDLTLTRSALWRFTIDGVNLTPGNRPLFGSAINLFVRDSVTQANDHGFCGNNVNVIDNHYH